MGENFVKAIKSVLHEENNGSIVKRLVQILPLGRDAIYRRLKGQIDFSLEEALIIARELHISMDKIYLDTAYNVAPFNVNLISVGKSPAENYYNILADYVTLFEKINNLESTKLRSAYNIMPYSFILDYDMISKFFLYKWLYQVNAIDHKVTLSDYVMPAKLRKIQSKFREENHCFRSASFILDRNIFTNFAEDIHLFYELELVNENEKEKLKTNLLNILKTIEIVSKTGHYYSGGEVTIYLADINIDASYTHFESDNFEMTHFRVFSVNGIESQDPDICKQSKMWIDSLRNYSTLITQSDATHRSMYFNDQRALIKKILK